MPWLLGRVETRLGAENTARAAASGALWDRRLPRVCVSGCVRMCVRVPYLYLFLYLRLCLYLCLHACLCTCSQCDVASDVLRHTISVGLERALAAKAQRAEEARLAAEKAAEEERLRLEAEAAAAQAAAEAAAKGEGEDDE